MPVTDVLRKRIGAAVIERVAGPRSRAPGALTRIPEADRWFAADRPIRQVHNDCAMFVGGIAALLLQSLHPLAMAAVADHSGYRADPWGRLQRTSHFIAATTFGRKEDAMAAIAKVSAIHAHVTGTAPDGRPYAAADPHLLTWVHVAEVYTFLHAYEAYGERPLSQAARDGYVADMALIAAELGVPAPPRTEAEVLAVIDRYRPELAGTPQAWEAARFLLREPPLPLVLRPVYAGLAMAAVALLPRWARHELKVPELPLADVVLARPAGHLTVNAIRWGISAQRLRGPGDADQVAFRIGEVADYQACRCPLGSHLALAAQALGFGQGRLDIGHADVEDDVARVAGTSADTARDAGPVGGGDAVNEAVVRWL